MNNYYLAGLFDGEGCLYCFKGKNDVPKLCASIVNRDRGVREPRG